MGSRAKQASLSLCEELLKVCLLLLSSPVGARGCRRELDLQFLSKLRFRVIGRLPCRLNAPSGVVSELSRDLLPRTGEPCGVSVRGEGDSDLLPSLCIQVWVNDGLRSGDSGSLVAERHRRGRVGDHGPCGDEDPDFLLCLSESFSDSSNLSDTKVRPRGEGGGALGEEDSFPWGL